MRSRRREGIAQISLVRCAAIAIAGALLLCAVPHMSAGDSGQNTPGNDARRIEFIQDALDGGRKRAAIWWYSWMGIYGGSGLVQTGLALFSEDRAERVLNVTEAAKSFIGLASLFVPPFSPAYAGNRLRKIPGETPDELKRKLTVAESSLDRAADIEAFETSILQHLGGILVNAAGFAVEWNVVVNRMHRDDLRPYIIANVAIGIAASELAILTLPTKAVRDRENYRREFKGDASEGPGRRIFFGYYPGGLSVGWRF